MLMKHPIEVLAYPMGDGQFAAPPVTKITPDIVPLPPSSTQMSDYRIPEDERVTIYSGEFAATLKLAPATGSKRTHTIINASAVSITVDAGDNTTISGSQTYTVSPQCSIAVLDYFEAHWVGTASIVPVVVVVAGHSVADAAYGVTGTGNQIITYTSISADRTVTLPAATTFGQSIIIQDASGSCAWGKKIIIAAAGSDKINGTTVTSTSIWVPYGSVTLQSDGTSKWFITGRAPKVWYTRWTATTSYTPEPDAIMERFIGVGAGGSGGNASGLYGGGGGGAGNVGEWEGTLTPGAAVTITIGAAGAARAAGAASNGANGGNVSVGAYLVCGGGVGGGYSAVAPPAGGTVGALQAMTSLELIRSRFVSINSSGTGYTGLSDTFTIGHGGSGSDGGASPATAGNAFLFPATYAGGAAGSDANVCAGGGGGGASPFGAGGAGGHRPVALQPVVAGGTGTGYGSGGGGAAVDGASNDGASGAGGPGMIDCWVFF